MDYLRYYFPVLLQLIGIAGILMGGGWVWIGVAELPLLALVDGFLDYDGRERSAASETLMDVPLVLSTILGVIMLVLITGRAGQGGLPTLEILGMIASGGWLTVIAVAPASHELYHKRVPWKYWLGMYAQLLYLDMTRSVAHVSGHHLAVCTPQDPDTPPRGMNMYQFVLYAAAGNARDVLAWEKAALAKRGLSVWSWQGRFAKALVALIALTAVLFMIGGVGGMAVGLSVALFGRVWLEAFNYLQHIGLVRVEGAPVGKRHVWNHFSPLTRIAGYEITNHCDHHQDAYIPYFRMRPDLDGADAKRLCLLLCRCRAADLDALHPATSPPSLGPALRHAGRAGTRSRSQSARRMAGLVRGRIQFPQPRYCYCCTGQLRRDCDVASAKQPTAHRHDALAR